MKIKKLMSIVCGAALLTSLALTSCGGGGAEKTDKAADAGSSAAVSESAAPADASGTTDAEAAADGDKSWDAVKDKGKLLMGLDDSLPPMGFRDDKNDIVGFDVDLAREVCKRLGIELVPVPIDWSMKQNELDSGNIDCIWNGFSYSDERNEACTLTKPYMKNEQVVVTMKDSGITTLADMKGKKLSLQEQSTAEQALDEHPEFKDTLAEVVPFKENVTAFKDIEAGQTDGLLIDSIMANYYISQQKDPGKYFVIPEPLASENYVIGFRKGDKALMEKVYDTLLEMKKDGTVAKISDKWFKKDITTLGE